MGTAATASAEEPQQLRMRPASPRWAPAAFGSRSPAQPPSSPCPPHPPPCLAHLMASPRISVDAASSVHATAETYPALSQSPPSFPAMEPFRSPSLTAVAHRMTT